MSQEFESFGSVFSSPVIGSQFLCFLFDGNFEFGAGGNFFPSSAAIGGKRVIFSAVCCFDLDHYINDNSV